jgi:hypothetical protein
MFYVTCGCTWKADELVMTFLWHMPLCTGHDIIKNQLFGVRGHAIAEVASSALWLRISKLNPRPVHVGFVVAKVVLSWVFLWVLCFSLSVSFHEYSTHILWLMYHWCYTVKLGLYIPWIYVFLCCTHIFIGRAKTSIRRVLNLPSIYICATYPLSWLSVKIEHKLTYCSYFSNS